MSQSPGPGSSGDSRRYRVGCAGMFILGTDWSTDVLDEAIAGCITPPGCEVLDSHTGRWLGPERMEDIEEAQARVTARRHGRLRTALEGSDAY